MMKKALSAMILALGISSVSAQDYAAENVKTVQMRSPKSEFSYPICTLGESILLEFDILDDNFSGLAYSIKHCNSDFEPDELSFNEFAEGFDDRDLDDYKNSFNTFQSFTHYKLTIPNNDISLSISGNYIVNIYESGDPDNVVLTQRFMVCENSDNSKISASVERPFRPEYSFNYQQVKATINTEKIKVGNPSKYMKVYVMQNGDFSTRKQLEISGFLNNEVQYHKNDGNNLFLGGSEFEFFDTKNVNFKSWGVSDIEYNNGKYNFVLNTYEPINNSYTFQEDLNGQYYIKNDKAFNRELESDYVSIKLRLKYDPFTNDKIYVYGNFNGFAYNKQNQMKLNKDLGVWETLIDLKQGLYNYQFVVKDKNGNIKEFPSGSWYNTENDYLITVYTTLPQNFGERLVMYRIINSAKNL